MSALLLKRLLLLFWGIWFTVVFATNLCDAAKAAGILSESWSFASGNYAAVCQTTAKYSPPAWFNSVLFACVLVWEAAAATAFWWGALAHRGQQTRALYAAFMIGLGLWAAFLLADEIFIAYGMAATHIRLFVAQLVTLLVIELVGAERAKSPTRPASRADAITSP
jgi:hypothetical protein